MKTQNAIIHLPLSSKKDLRGTPEDCSVTRLFKIECSFANILAYRTNTTLRREGMESYTRIEMISIIRKTSTINNIGNTSAHLIIRFVIFGYYQCSKLLLFI